MKNEYTVLLAEDAEAFRLPIINDLEDVGFNVIAVEDQQGIIAYGSKADLLLVDARLPTARLEGIEGVAHLISSNSIKVSTPVIFMSVLQESECQKKIDDYSLPHNRYKWFTKPINMDSLIRTMIESLSVELTSYEEFVSLSIEEKACILNTFIDLLDVPDGISVVAIAPASTKPYMPITTLTLRQVEQGALTESSEMGYLRITENILKERLQERSRKVERYTSIEFPDKCYLDRKTELKIQLTIVPPLDPFLKNIAKIQYLRESAQLSLAIYITAPTFLIQSSLEMMRIPVDHASDIVVFEMTPKESGKQVVEIEIFFRSERIGYYTIESEVLSNV